MGHAGHCTGTSDSSRMFLFQLIECTCYVAINSELLKLYFDVKTRRRLFNRNSLRDRAKAVESIDDAMILGIFLRRSPVIDFLLIPLLSWLILLSLRLSFWFPSITVFGVLTTCFGIGIVLSWIVGTLLFGAIAAQVLCFCYFLIDFHKIFDLSFTANCFELKISSTQSLCDAFPSIDKSTLSANIPRSWFSSSRMLRGSWKFSREHSRMTTHVAPLAIVFGLGVWWVHVIYLSNINCDWTGRMIRISYDPRYQLLRHWKIYRRQKNRFDKRESLIAFGDYVDVLAGCERALELSVQLSRHF